MLPKKRLCRSWRGQEGVEIHTIFQIADICYTIQTYSLHPIINYFYYKKIVIDRETIVYIWQAKKEQNEKLVVKVNCGMLMVYSLILFKS